MSADPVAASRTARLGFVAILALGVALCTLSLPPLVGATGSRPPVTPPKGPPPPSGPAPPSTTKAKVSYSRPDALQAALVALARTTWKMDGRLPGHCTQIKGERVCVPVVTVDGHALSDIGGLGALISAVEAVRTSRREPARWAILRPLLHSVRAQHDGMAMAVFQEVLYREGLRGGIHASPADERVIAAQQFSYYRRFAVVRARAPIPPGMAPRQYFYSSRLLAAYGRLYVQGKERQRIVGHGQYHVTWAEIEARWFARILPRYRVRVNGRPPAFSVSAAYRDLVQLTHGWN